MNYTVADVVGRIKNAVLARRRTVVFPYSKLTKGILTLLGSLGYIKDVAEVEEEGKKLLKAEIRYDKRQAIFTDARIISKPSVRVYATVAEIVKKDKKSVGSLIVSTNTGLMTGKEAIKKSLGGEILFEIW